MWFRRRNGSVYFSGVGTDSDSMSKMKKTLNRVLTKFEQLKAPLNADCGVEETLRTDHFQVSKVIWHPHKEIAYYRFMTVDWFYWNVYGSILFHSDFYLCFFFFVADGQIWFSIRANISSIRPCPASLSDWHKIRVVKNVSFNLFIFHTEGLLKGFFYYFTSLCLHKYKWCGIRFIDQVQRW